MGVADLFAAATGQPQVITVDCTAGIRHDRLEALKKPGVTP